SCSEVGSRPTARTRTATTAVMAPRALSRRTPMSWSPMVTPASLQPSRQGGRSAGRSAVRPSRPHPPPAARHPRPGPPGGAEPGDDDRQPRDGRSSRHGEERENRSAENEDQGEEQAEAVRRESQDHDRRRARRAEDADLARTKPSDQPSALERTEAVATR